MKVDTVTKYIIIKAIVCAVNDYQRLKNVPYEKLGGEDYIAFESAKWYLFSDDSTIYVHMEAFNLDEVVSLNKIRSFCQSNHSEIKIDNYEAKFYRKEKKNGNLVNAV